MVYKKYIKRSGKLHGPYYYESYRDHGKIKHRYLGTKHPKKKNLSFNFNLTINIKFSILILMIGFALVIGVYFNNQLTLTGQGLHEDEYEIQVELPVETLQESPEQPLNEEIEDSSSDQQESVDESTDKSTEIPSGSPPTPSETPDETPQDTVIPIEADESSDQTSSTNNTLIEETDIIEVSNETEESKNETLEEPNKDSNITEKTNKTIPKINDSIQKVNETIKVNETQELNKSQIIINDSNSLDNETKEELILIPDLNESLDTNITQNITESNITIEQANITFFKEIPLIRIPKGENASINLNEHFTGEIQTYELLIANFSISIENNTLFLNPDPEFKGARKAKIFATTVNTTIESNQFTILVSSGAINIKTDRDDIVLGQKVKWKKNITLDVPENVTIELEKTAENITITKIIEGIETNASNSLISASAILRIQPSNKLQLSNFFKRILSIFTGRAIDTPPADETPKEAIEIVEISLEDEATEYIIEYYTEEPKAVEQNTSTGKTVTISALDELNYTDVLSFTTVGELFPVGKENRIKVFWEENNSFVPSDAYDLDGNNLLDYVEWVTPHLSNQTFKIIYITEASHLDENREFIEDIFDLVNDRDQNWTDPIPTDHYIRIKFEIPLDSSRDITLYAKSDTPGATVEVYEINGTELLATFPEISADDKYQIFLTELQNPQDQFDLKIINGPIEFDYIVDPLDNYQENCDSISDWTISPAGGWSVTSSECVSNTNGQTNLMTVTDSFKVSENDPTTFEFQRRTTGFTGGDNTFTAYARSSASGWTSVYSTTSNLTMSTISVDLDSKITVDDQTQLRFECDLASAGACVVDSITVQAVATAPVPTCTSVGGDTTETFRTNDSTPTVLVSTDEDANCRASNDGDETYAQMSDDVDCTGDNTKSHTCQFTSAISDSTTTIYVACGDITGTNNSAANNEECTTQIDTTLPTQSAHNPSSGSTICSSSQTLTFTTSEVGDCRATLDSDESYQQMSDDFDCTVGTSTSHSCSLTGLVDGTENVWTACQDDTTSLPNKDTSSTNTALTYTVDSTNPIITTTNVSHDTTSTYRINISTPTVYHTTDEASTCRFSTTDQSYSAMGSGKNCQTTGSTSHACTFGSLADGTHTLYIACADSACGNDHSAAQNTELTTVIDTAPPEPSSYSPASSSTITSTSVTLTFTTDETGDCRASTDGDESYNDMSDDFDCTTGTSTSHSCSLTGLSQGANTIYIGCSDDTTAYPTKDSTSTNEFITITVDSVQPSPSIDSVGGDTSSPYNISDNTPHVNATTDENANCRASNDGDESYNNMADDIDCTGDGGTSHKCLFGTLSDGYHKIYVACQDTATNNNTASDNIIARTEIDTAVPTQSSHSPSNLSTITTTSPTITFTTNELADCFASLDGDETFDGMSDDINCTGGGTTSHSCVMSGLSQGTEIVYIACEDDTSVDPNKDTAATNEEIQYTIDSVPPDVTINFPANLTYKQSDLPLVFNVSLSTNGSVLYSLTGGSSNITMTSTDEGTIFGLLFDDSNNSIANAGYRFSVYANDTNGNANNTESIDFSMEAGIPGVNISFPLNITYGSADLPLPINVSIDINGSVLYSLDGGINNITMTSTDEGTIFGLLFDDSNASIADGAYTLSAYANTTTGSNNYSESVTFNVDATFPVPIFESPTNNNGANITSTSIFVNVSVTETNEVNITFLLYNSSSLVNESTFTTAIRTINWSVTSDLTYRYNVTVSDISSNRNTTETRIISLDSSGPIISYVAPTEVNNTFINQNFILINVTASDASLQSIRIELFNENHSLINTSQTSTSPNDINFSSYGDGNYFYNASANDSAGQTSYLETRNITLDTIFPAVNITHPQNRTYATTSLTINFSASDRNRNTCYYTTDGGTTNTTLTSCANITYTASQGSTTISMRVNDSANNLNDTISRTFFVDSLIPGIDYSSGTEINGSFISQSNILINISATDTNFANITLRLYNSSQHEIGLNVSNSNPYFKDYTSLADGIYYFNASVYDIAGNINETVTRNVTLDTINPSVNITEPRNITYDTTALTINYTATDTNLQTCYYTDNGGTTNTTLTNCGNTTYTASQGSTTITLFINDSANNLNSTQSLTFFVDTLTPSVEFGTNTEINGSFISRNNIVINASASDPNVANITIQLFNSSHNQIQLNISNTNPYQKNYTSLSDGVYYFNATTYDVGGNVNYTTTLNVTLDTVYPNVTIAQPQNTSYNYTDLTINFSTRDIHLQTCYYTDNGGTTNTTLTNCGNTTYTASQGSTSIFVKSNDSANNLNDTTSITFFIDSIKPVPSFGANTEVHGSFISRKDIIINVTINDTNFLNLSVTLFDANFTILNTSTSTSNPTLFNFTNQSEGTYYFNSTSYDIMGNVNYTETRNITVDITTPRLIIHSPNSTNYSTSSILFNITTDLEANAVWITIDGGLSNYSMSSNLSININGSVYYNFTNTSIPDGDYLAQFYINDSSNNVNNSESTGFAVDTTFPTISFGTGTPANNSLVDTQGIYINVTANDSKESVITFWLQNGTALYNRSLFTDGTRIENFSSIYNDTYTFNVSINDSAGNINFTETRIINFTGGILPPQPPLPSAGGGGSGGGGGGGGGGIAASITVGTFEIGVNTINRILKIGEEIFEILVIRNTGEKSSTVHILIDKELAGIVSIDNEITIQPQDASTIRMRLFGKEAGVYEGNIYFFGQKVTKTYLNETNSEFDTAIGTPEDISIQITNTTYILPVKVIVKGSEEKLLDLSITLDKTTIDSGQTLDFTIRAINLGILDKYNFDLSYEIYDDSERVLIVGEDETATIEDSLSLKRSLTIPEITANGRYKVIAIATFGNSSAIAKESFTIGEGFFDLSPIIEGIKDIDYQALINGIKSGKYLVIAYVYLPFIIAILFLLILIIIAIYYFRFLKKKLFLKKMEEKKSKSIYIFPNFGLLPKSQFAYIGQVADSGTKTYLDHTQLNRHTLIAGGTGSGKTISGMVIVEEILKKSNFPVIVFDPIGQWTGFAKKNEDKKMISLFKKYNVNSPQAFKTRIIEINEKTINVDISHYLKTKGLTVLKLDKLSPAKLDKFIEDNLEKVYTTNQPESESLKSLIVFDEVHRLLPKYGGRKAHLKLEQAVREFRKWGIGLLMISQVLTDFKGAIRGNIGTEIQMRTRYEGDIKRVKTRHGTNISSLIAKMPTGLGMIESSDYNKGMPYFVEFRPIQHSPFKLIDSILVNMLERSPYLTKQILKSNVTKKNHKHKKKHRKKR
jgi:hypothetical protein